MASRRQTRCSRETPDSKCLNGLSSRMTALPPAGGAFASAADADLSRRTSCFLRPRFCWLTFPCFWLSASSCCALGFWNASSGSWTVVKSTWLLCQSHLGSVFRETAASLLVQSGQSRIELVRQSPNPNSKQFLTSFLLQTFKCLQLRDFDG